MADKLKYILFCSLCLVWSAALSRPNPYAQLPKKAFQVYENFLMHKITPEQLIQNMVTLENENNWHNMELALNIKLYKALGYQYSNRTAQSIKECELGLAKIKSEKVRNDTLQFKLLSDMAYYQNAALDYESALKSLDQGSFLLQKNPKLKELIKDYCIAFYSNYSKLMREKGDINKSILLLNEAMTLTNTPETKYFKLFIYKSLASNFVLLEETDKAKAYYLQASKIAKKGDEIADIEVQLTQLFLKLNQAENAKSHLIHAQKSLGQSAFANAGSEFPQIEMAIENQWAQYYFLIKNHKESLKHCSRVLAISKAKFGNQKGPHVADVYALMARVSNSEMYFEKAVNACFYGVKNDLEELVSVEKYVEILWEKSLFYHQKRHLKKDQVILEAVKNINLIKSSLEEDDSKLYFLKSKSDFYEKALEMISPQNIAGIFKIMEYSKAALITDVLKKNKFKYTGIPKELIQKELHAKREINKYRLKINNANTLLEKKESETKLRQAQLVLNNIQTEIKVNYPAYQKQVHTLDSIDISEIRKALNPDQSMINVFYSERKIGILWIDKTETIYRNIVNSPGLESQLKSLVKEINTNPGISEFDCKNTSKVLFSQLFGSFEKQFKNTKQIIVIRDGLLQYLPFEVLIDQNGKFLIENYEFQYSWSANIWNLEKSDKVKTRKHELMAIAPFTSENASSSLSEDLKPLLASKKEVEQIGGDIYLEKNAKKELFFSNYQNYNIIHFATHAQLNDTDPNLSFIAFYPDEKESKLFTQELFDLKFQKTQLVVLSACEGGYGYYQKGEGLMSLARAFAYGGCPSVITTLWKANDETSAYIASRIHKYLKRGFTKSKAVQQAKLDLLQDGEFGQYDHPYYWSNFILIGNNNPLITSFFEIYKFEIFWIILLILSLGIILYFNYRRLKK